MNAFKFLLLLLTSVGSGCSSLVTLSCMHEEEPDMSGGYIVTRVYSGTVNTLAYFRSRPQDVLPVLTDLPFSFALDTVALPYTIYAQIRYGNLSDGSYYRSWYFACPQCQDRETLLDLPLPANPTGLAYAEDELWIEVIEGDSLICPTCKTYDEWLKQLMVRADAMPD